MESLADFNVQDELGYGSYSTVYRVSLKATNTQYALKVCRKALVIREKKVKQVFRERDLLAHLSTKENERPFIVQLYATFQDTNSLYFVQSYAMRGDLSRIINEKTFDGKTVRFVIGEICNALDYIHSHNILHRDVKPENIFVKEDYHLMLGDFGCSIEHAQNHRSSFVGSDLYVCPEILNGVPIDETCDFFSVGSITYEMLFGEAPFDDKTEYLVLQRILNAEYRFPSNSDADAEEVIRGLLEADQAKRLGSPKNGGFSKIKGHPFFKGINWETLPYEPSPLASYSSGDSI